MSARRLPPIAGEWIDRSQILPFTFEGNSFWGYAGDTITTALVAAGQRVMGRSFKYHRPRGVLSLANHDVNALIQDGQQLNIRADITPLEAGMSLTAVNTKGGLMGDRASVLNFFSPFLPVGFYYKAFHDKNRFPFWERLIRTISGLGKVDTSTPHIRTPKCYDFCDVLVVGAGISGLSAALTAADAGADVVIVDENAQAGGAGCYQRGGETWQAETTIALLQTVQNHPQIRVYLATQAAGYYADHWIPLVDKQCLTKMRAKAVIMATGAYEQPAVFHNNDLPGVMLASAAQRLIYRYAVQPMERAVVLVANQDGYRAAIDLATHGITVMAIVDLRPNNIENDLTKTIQAIGIPIYYSHCIYEAKSNPAVDRVSTAVICPIDADGQPQTEDKQAIACDGIIMSVGWAPAANLLYQAGTQMRFDPSLQQFVPEILPAGIFACGRVNGVYEFDQKITDGERAGSEAIQYLGMGDGGRQGSRSQEPGARSQEPGARSQEPGARSQELELTQNSLAPHPTPHTPHPTPPSHPFPLIAHPAGKNFVDFDEDLQLKDFYNAAQEGFDNIELLKRFTTVGMGPSQGKHSNMNALRILARITGKSPGQVGTTTARPFFHPVPLSHLAGRGFMPERQTPLHSRHTALGATFLLAGQWRRPAYYAQSGKDRSQCIQREAEAVRTRVGIIDVGTLGKLELRGSDAAEFLERVYTGRYTNLKVGMSRYALMLDEAGVIVDDGVIARLGADHFYFTTTTSGAAAIYRELSRLNTMWQLDCGLVNLTGARSAINLAGPNARHVLTQLTDCDLSGTAFPYLAVREATVAGIPAILMRVGFVGEWGYEIHVAAESAPALWDALLEAGAEYGICPFGVEAQRLLRLEKGHLIVGQDTDGLTTPFEANLEWAAKLDKPFFIGQRSLQTVAKRPIKQKLVGFMLAQNFRGTPPQECHLIIDSDQIAGRVTSIGFSPVLKRFIGLAYVKPELADNGMHFSIRLTDGALISATVTATPFYDLNNLRQKEAAQRQEVPV
ncbi:(2Fe-2S)-binding protein (plasmid) [Kovacikia minuta CCNUW1]|uniref:2Fe-2S iron-sulfur cluster-binding protein n=1 Tax=Kovacikia minuta TaxID=2931930 RepID=UPI001CCF9369|nr:2Fe-2S iron-sulfur cluster-binding protein [Kovacikia minuta]UBF30293.1 (2Fe-2S)-binding protein [Kovacikia minuta CCNUW1]